MMLFGDFDHLLGVFSFGLTPDLINSDFDQLEASHFMFSSNLQDWHHLNFDQNYFQ
jgi:hypothetical protein